ncbi:uncharacterized protein LOC120355147 isoform X2 [Nilaparvata lugens]|uniref:uncharacterized protein LOC120355147 isoform X2 n=1 Tax=Nilaparvata lugens TaxID=108931 RepID=UPI00193EB52C|nr:uncharacterized protein LOC120355147 isoform X2 [Nilaparvata lugens]
MWTLIFREDESLYDAVPNNWIDINNPTNCFYPDRMKSTTIKMARECATIEEDWEVANIEIIKRDYGGQTVMKIAMQDMHLDLISRMEKKDKQPRDGENIKDVESDDGEESPAEEGKVYSFSFKSLEDFMIFDKSLKPNEEKKSAVSAMLKVGCHTSCGRSATTTLRGILGDSVIECFTWKGQQRFGVQKNAFYTTTTSKILISALSKKWKVKPETIEKSFKSFLAQMQTKKRSQLRTLDEEDDISRVQVPQE